MKNIVWLGVLFCMWMLMTGCAPKPVFEINDSAPEKASKNDLLALRERGTLRILLERFESQHLPRNGVTMEQQREAAITFAEKMGLEPELVYLSDPVELIPALLDGRGDVIASSMEVSASRKRKVAFTLPLDSDLEQLVGTADQPIPLSLAALGGQTLGAREGSFLLETALQLKESIPGLKVRILPATWTHEHVLNQIVEGSLDIVIENSSLLDHLLAERIDVAVLWTLNPPRKKAWAVRRENTQLLGALNRFLFLQRLVQEGYSVRTGDYDAIKESKVLRLITRNNATSYFLWRGELLGFEYELAARFAQLHGLRLEVVVAPTHRDMLPMLIEGEGDIVAAFLEATPERMARGVAFSRPYHYAREMVVARADDQQVHSLLDLAGRTLVVRPSSSYWNTLQEWKAKGMDFTLQAAPETMETEEIIACVADGRYDLTVADDHLLELEMTWRDDVRACFALGEPVAHGWAVRMNNPELLEKINDFFDEEYRGLFYNLIQKKYFQTPRESPRSVQTGAAAHQKGSPLSPYDDFIKNAAKQYGFDWRLICAQLYQESRFDPDAVSWTGAQGLMQLLPTTAGEMGYRHLKRPENGIEAGVKYLDWLRDQWGDTLFEDQALLFSLASYNVGLGHVLDAQQLAQEKGLNPSLWFDHVEKAMLLLSKPYYANRAEYGYCRGQETVSYVREIQDRYDAYCQLVDSPSP